MPKKLMDAEIHAWGLLEVPLNSTPWGEVHCWASSLNLYTSLPRDLLGGGADSGIMSFMRALVPYTGVRAEKKKESVPDHERYCFFHCPCCSSPADILQVLKESRLGNRILLGSLLDQLGGMSLPTLPARSR